MDHFKNTIQIWNKLTLGFINVLFRFISIWRTLPCQYYLRHGFCRYLDRCFYDHAEAAKQYRQQKRNSREREHDRDSDRDRGHHSNSHRSSYTGGRSHYRTPSPPSSSSRHSSSRHRERAYWFSSQKRPFWKINRTMVSDFYFLLSLYMVFVFRRLEETTTWTYALLYFTLDFLFLDWKMCRQLSSNLF